ncbi:MAG: hypothetical protein QCH35_05895 [Methanomicrobiaceae archaeon]|nr:hypothetical protein [Methanomicrobiaceae archaeon]
MKFQKPRIMDIFQKKNYSSPYMKVFPGGAPPQISGNEGYVYQPEKRKIPIPLYKILWRQIERKTRIVNIQKGIFIYLNAFAAALPAGCGDDQTIA